MGSFLSSPATDADLLASPDAYDSRSLRKSEGYTANACLAPFVRYNEVFVENCRF